MPRAYRQQTGRPSGWDFKSHASCLITRKSFISSAFHFWMLRWWMLAIWISKIIPEIGYRIRMLHPTHGSRLFISHFAYIFNEQSDKCFFFCMSFDKYIIARQPYSMLNVRWHSIYSICVKAYHVILALYDLKRKIIKPFSFPSPEPKAT